MKELKQPYNLTGLDGLVRETTNFERIAKAVFNIITEKVYGSTSTPGLSIYAYGSPGRIEMVGGDSDADIFILESKETKKGTEFRKQFAETMERFDYSKLDLPEWGKLAETEIYLEKSLIEGNQILETRFLCGDAKLNMRLEKLKSKYNSPERAIKNIIFNRLYLDEYFSKKVRAGALNVKYCKGGSRELLFISWYDGLLRLINAEEGELSKEPRFLIGLKKALERNAITEIQYRNAIRAINFLSILRTDILSVNKSTKDRGLTYLDEDTIKRLEDVGYSSSEIKYSFEQNRRKIRGVINKIYQNVIQIGGDLKGPKWKKELSLAQNNIFDAARQQIESTDPTIAISLLWSASTFNKKEFFQELSERYKNTEEWCIIGSIVNSSFCNPEILQHFGEGKAKEKGYGYLLRVIARNPNTPKRTLKSIVEDPNLEERYKAIAEAALLGGIERTQNQI